MKRVLATCFAVTLFAVILSSAAFGQTTTSLRGVMVSPDVQASDLQFLAQVWNVNLVRWQLTWIKDTGGPSDTATSAEYNAWLESALQKLDRLLPVCQMYGLKVLIDLHTTPGGRLPSCQNRIFVEKIFQDQFLEIWKKMAARYAGNTTVWGYDLANEPIQGTVATGLLDWRQLAIATATYIRAVDTSHTLVIEPENWATPDSFKTFIPLPSSIEHVVYSLHMYSPLRFTHQRIDNNDAVRYPGVIDKVVWNKKQMRKALQPVVDFQNKYGVQIYVGEFSAVRWAPAGSAYLYLKDAISLFEENGWDWTYHAFREWDGWSAEHTEDRSNKNRATGQTNREKLLRSWFSKNRH